MRSTKARLRVETLEGRALLATSAGLLGPSEIVSDQVGVVDVSVFDLSNIGDASAGTAETVTVTTSGITAVPGVDYTPVQQTITLTPGQPSTVSIPILPGPASLGTRTLRVSVSPTPGAPQGESQVIAIVHGADAEPPFVVKSQALTKGGKVVAFALKFSEPMATGTATNPANYVVSAPATKREILSTAFGGHGGLSKRIPLKSALYDAATATVYLVPIKAVNPRSFGLPVFEIGPPTSTVDAPISNLTDTSGNPIAPVSGISFYDLSVGTFNETPRLAKASPSVLSFLLGTPARPGAKLASKLK